MQYTENLNLAKYESNDVTSYLEVANANMTKIDAGHGALKKQVSTNTTAIGNVKEDVDGMVPKVADADTKANAGLTNTASVYDATQTYAVGDYTLYNNNLYECNTPIPQAESFDGTKWTRVKITDDVKKAKNDITQINTIMSNGCKLVNIYTLDTTDLNGNVNISNVHPMIKPGNFISIICDDSGMMVECSPYEYHGDLYVHVRGMFDGQSKLHTQISFSINYIMPLV